MKVVEVVFKEGGKRYAYYTNLNLIKGAVYDIIVNGSRTYSTPVRVEEFVENAPSGIEMSTITAAKLLCAPPRKNSGVAESYCNLDKGTVTLKWVDGVITTVKCDPKDTFDLEKGVALCYMKRFFENRGYYNDVIATIIEKMK